MRLTDKQAAPYIGLSTATLRSWRCRGNPDHPPFYRIGSGPRARVFFESADLDAWLAARRHEPQAEANHV